MLKRPTATATIEPIGRRTTNPRNHSIKIAINLSPIEPRFADRTHVAGVARAALADFAPPVGENDRRKFDDVTVSGKTGGPGIVIAVEGSLVWPGRPGDDLVDHLRAALAGAGYRSTLREKRECGEPACAADAVVEWNRPSEVPRGWYSNVTCGKHNFRACAKCHSIYVFTSASSVGQAPSVPCEVCGAIMVGWGSSKIWNAELVTRVEVAT